MNTPHDFLLLLTVKCEGKMTQNIFLPFLWLIWKLLIPIWGSITIKSSKLLNRSYKRGDISPVLIVFSNQHHQTWTKAELVLRPFFSLTLVSRSSLYGFPRMSPSFSPGWSPGVSAVLFVLCQAGFPVGQQGEGEFSVPNDGTVVHLWRQNTSTQKPATIRSLKNWAIGSGNLW